MFVSLLSTILDAIINTLLENEQLGEKVRHFLNSSFEQSTFPKPVHKTINKTLFSINFNDIYLPSF